MPRPRGCPRRSPRLRGGHLGDSARPALSPSHGAMQCWHPVPRAGSGPWPGLLTAAERGQRVGRGGESREQGCPPPARVAAGRAAPALAVRQRLLTQKRLSAPQPPARVVPTALAPSRPCRLVIGVYLWSVWCTWGSGDALESQRRADRDGCLQTGGPRFQARVRPAAGRRGWGRREVPTAGPEGRSSPAPSRRGVYPGCRASSSRRTFKSLFVIAKAIYVYYRMLWKCHVFKKCGKETSKPVMDAVAHEWLPPCVPRCPYVAALTAS